MHLASRKKVIRKVEAIEALFEIKKQKNKSWSNWSGDFEIKKQKKTKAEAI